MHELLLAFPMLFSLAQKRSHKYLSLHEKVITFTKQALHNPEFVKAATAYAQCRLPLHKNVGHRCQQTIVNSNDELTLARFTVLCKQHGRRQLEFKATLASIANNLTWHRSFTLTAQPVAFMDSIQCAGIHVRAARIHPAHRHRRLQGL